MVVLFYRRFPVRGTVLISSNSNIMPPFPVSFPPLPSSMMPFLHRDGASMSVERNSILDCILRTIYHFISVFNGWRRAAKIRRSAGATRFGIAFLIFPGIHVGVAGSIQ